MRSIKNDKTHAIIALVVYGYSIAKLPIALIILRKSFFIIAVLLCA